MNGIAALQIYSIDDEAMSTAGGEELARIARDVADRIEAIGLEPEDRYPVSDVNGNTIGQFVVVEDESALEVMTDPVLQARIDLGNEAFDGGNAGMETARILRDLAKKVSDASLEDVDIPLSDINGNRVGDLKSLFDNSPEARGDRLFSRVMRAMNYEGLPEDIPADVQAFFSNLGEYALDHVDEFSALPGEFEFHSDDGRTLIEIEDGQVVSDLIHWGSQEEIDSDLVSATELLDETLVDNGQGMKGQEPRP